MASDGEDDDLAALRMAALASMKKQINSGDSRSNSPAHHVLLESSSLPNIHSQGENSYQGAPVSPQRQNFYRNDRRGFRGRGRGRGFGRGNNNWRGQPGGRGRGGRGGPQDWKVEFPPPRAANLIVINTVPMEGEEPSPPPQGWQTRQQVHRVVPTEKPKNKFILLPQDRWAGTGSDSAPDSPPKNKGSSKFSRFESRDSDEEEEDDLSEDDGDQQESDDDKDSVRQSPKGSEHAQSDDDSLHDSLLDSHSDNESILEKPVSQSPTPHCCTSPADQSKGAEGSVSRISPACRSRSQSPCRTLTSPVEHLRRSLSPSSEIQPPPFGVHRIPSPTSHRCPSPASSTFSLSSPKHSPQHEPNSDIPGSSSMSSALSSRQLSARRQSPSPPRHSLPPRQSPPKRGPPPRRRSVSSPSPPRHSLPPRQSPPKRGPPPRRRSVSSPSPPRHSLPPRQSPPKQGPPPRRRSDSPLRRRSRSPLRRLSPEHRISPFRKISPHAKSPTRPRNIQNMQERTAFPRQRRSPDRQSSPSRHSLSPLRCQSVSPVRKSGSKDFTSRPLVQQRRHSRSRSREPVRKRKSSVSSSDWSDSEFSDSSSLHSSPERISPKHKQVVSGNKQIVSKSLSKSKSKCLAPKEGTSERKGYIGKSKDVKSVSKMHEKSKTSSNKIKPTGKVKSKTKHDVDKDTRIKDCPKGIDSAKLEARKKKFQEGNTLRPESKTKKKISLKGIVSDSSSSSKRKEKENCDRGTSHSKSKSSVKQKKESKSRPTFKSKHDRGEIEKPRLKEDSESDSDSGPQVGSVDSLFSDSESEDETAPWRYTHTGRNTKGEHIVKGREGKPKLFERDSFEIERERRLRYEKKTREHAEQRNKQRENSKEEYKREHRTRDQQSESHSHKSWESRSDNRQKDQAIGRSRPGFKPVESDDSLDTDSDHSQNPPVRSFLSVVNQPGKSRSRSVSPAARPRKHDRGQDDKNLTRAQDAVSRSRTSSTRVIISGEKERDARSVLSRLRPQPSSDEDVSDDKSTGHYNPVVNVTFNTEALLPEKGSAGPGGGRLSVHQRLGLPVAKPHSGPLSSRLGSKKQGEPKQQRRVITHHHSSPEPDSEMSRNKKRKEKHKHRSKDKSTEKDSPPRKRSKVITEGGSSVKPVRRKVQEDEDDEDISGRHSPAENELDAKIRKIQQNNAAILRKKQQVQAEQQKYGIPSQRI